MLGGRQRLSLGTDCHTVGIAAHEFGKCFYSPAIKDKGFAECQKYLIRIAIDCPSTRKW